MASHNTLVPRSSSRNRLLQRSCSVQPEDTLQVSSPKSLKRKSRNPGRSLTEIFTAKTRTRSSSSESSALLRRRTFTAGASVCETSVTCIKDNIGSIYMNRSFSELSFPIHSIDDSVSVVNDSEDLLEKEKHAIPLSLPDDDTSVVNQQMESRLSSDKKSKCAEELKENNVKPSLYWKVLRIAFKIMLWVISILLITVLLLVGFSTYFVYEKTQCELKREMKMPLEELKKKFTLSVIGQEIAVDMILNSLSDLEMNNIDSPLILWMVGWTGSGKTHTASIVRNSFSSISKVFTVIPSLFPKNNDDLLREEVFGLFRQLNLCSYNIIVIDGWDEDNLPLQILEQFIINLQNVKHQKNAKGKTIIVLCGTQGSQYFNREYFKLILSGKKRKNLKIKDFEHVTKTLTQVQELNDITKSFVIVPFIPMEIEQVKMCIMEEFLRLEESSVLAKGYNQEKIISQIMKQLNFVPPNNPRVSDTGCKRVQPLLRLSLFEDVDNTV